LSRLSLPELVAGEHHQPSALVEGQAARLWN
jgi:hypothetical protein